MTTRKKKIRRKQPLLRYSCSKCSSLFISWQQRNEHERYGHKPPMVTNEKSVGITGYETLRNAYTHLEVGDVFYRVEKCVVKETTHTEGMRDLQVEYEVTKKNWKVTKPQ